MIRHTFQYACQTSAAHTQFARHRHVDASSCEGRYDSLIRRNSHGLSAAGYLHIESALIPGYLHRGREVLEMDVGFDPASRLGCRNDRLEKSRWAAHVQVPILGRFVEQDRKIKSLI